MFNKLKQFKDMRSQAKSLESALAEKTVTVEKDGNTLTMDGNQEIKELKLNSELSTEELEKSLPSLFKEANDKVKRLMAETMQSMGGLNMPGM